MSEFSIMHKPSMPREPQGIKYKVYIISTPFASRYDKIYQAVQSGQIISYYKYELDRRNIICLDKHDEELIQKHKKQILGDNEHWAIIDDKNNYGIFIKIPDGHKNPDVFKRYSGAVKQYGQKMKIYNQWAFQNENNLEIFDKIESLKDYIKSSKEDIEYYNGNLSILSQQASRLAIRIFEKKKQIQRIESQIEKSKNKIEDLEQSYE